MFSESLRGSHITFPTSVEIPGRSDTPITAALLRTARIGAAIGGAKDSDDFHEKSKDMTLDGVMERIKVPFLVTHGAQDRQISVDYAHQSYEQLTNSPQRELKIFTPREGGVEHVGADNMSYGCDYIADWFADTLGGDVTGKAVS